MARSFLGRWAHRGPYRTISTVIDAHSRGRILATPGTVFDGLQWWVIKKNIFVRAFMVALLLSRNNRHGNDSINR